MELAILRKLVSDFKDGKITNNSNYVHLFVVEQVFKAKIEAFNRELEDYKKYLSSLIGFPIEIKVSDNDRIEINYRSLLSYNGIMLETKSDSDVVIYPCFGKPKKAIKILESDERTKEFVYKTAHFRYLASLLYLGMRTNIRLFVHFNIEDFKIFKILISDDIGYDMGKIKLPSLFYNYGNFKPIKGSPLIGAGGADETFYYYMDSNNERSLFFNNDKVKDILNEELLGEMIANMYIDISWFDEKFQEEIRNAHIYNKLGLKNKQREETEALRQQQVVNIMEAYKLMQKAAQLLNNCNMDMEIERIKLDNLRSIIFKNGWRPNRHGYIEFEEILRTNMLLRMLDLSELDLTNVDIRGMDFSYCNVNINPQTIYNKDMSYVNATGVGFPFWYSFDKVTLDGAIINDWEAAIYLDKLKSYNEDTFIGKDVVKGHGFK